MIIGGIQFKKTITFRKKIEKRKISEKNAIVLKQKVLTEMRVLRFVPKNFSRIFLLIKFKKFSH